MANHYPDREQIEKRAYEFYCERGYEHGRDIDDWVRAEQELSASPRTGSLNTEDQSRISAQPPATPGSFPARQKPGPEAVAPVRAQQKSAAAGRNKS